MLRLGPASGYNGYDYVVAEGADTRMAAPENFFCMEQALATASLAAFIYEGFVYNVIFLQRILPAVGKDAYVPVFGVLFNVFWGLAFWSWLQAHLGDPGVLPDHWVEFVQTVGQALPVVDSKREWQPGRASFCQHCSFPRPERAHHCRVCNACVLKMDHHCPFIKNCVGFGNYKVFLLLLVYGSCSCAVSLVTAFPELLICLESVVCGTGTPSLQDPLQGLDIRRSDAWLLLLFGALALPFMMIFPPMASSHFMLAAHNQTRIENSYSNMPNPYNMGTGQNFGQIFGEFGVDWVLPVKPWRRKLNGVSFARNDINAGGKMGLDADADSVDHQRLLRIRYKVPLPDAMRFPVLEGQGCTSLIC